MLSKRASRAATEDVEALKEQGRLKADGSAQDPIRVSSMRIQGGCHLLKLAADTIKYLS